VVRGFRKETVAPKSVRTVDNDRFAETGEVFSLAAAISQIGGETVVAYGDVLFRRYILDGLMTSRADIVLAVDASNLNGRGPDNWDRVTADRAFSGGYLDDEPAKLLTMSHGVRDETVHGEWMGLARFSPRGAEWLVEEIQALEAEGALETADMPLLFSRLALKHTVRVKYFFGHWMNVNTLIDLADARNFA
jgi:phosphoenolpyruvate phosphomutase